MRRLRRGLAWLSLPRYLLGLVLVPFRRARRSKGISGDARARRQEMLGMTAGVARTVAGARLRSLFRGRERKAELRREAMEKATQTAVEQLGAMKGLSMKLGQMMSYLSVLSEEGEEKMSELQASVPAMEPDLVDAVIEEQLGALPGRLFDHFDIQPVAAASVGQVHRARLHDGREVAVKVQYPGVIDAFRADLANLASMTSVAALSTKADLTEYFALISDSLMGELDYTAEARNQQRLADLYHGHPYVVIPDTVPELCRPKVLVSEFVQGRRFREMANAPSQEERDRVGEIMYRFAFGCIMNGFFSGDPHPGNYLFPTDGRVCFLDFGMVLEITAPGHAGQVSAIVAGALAGDQAPIDKGLRKLGFLPESGPPGEEVWHELEEVVVGPIEIDAPTRLDRAVFHRSIQTLMNPRSNVNRATMKTEAFEAWAALLMRYAAGSLAAISKLAPEANWRRIVAEIVLGDAPRTEIGARWGKAPGGSEWKGSRAAT